MASNTLNKVKDKLLALRANPVYIKELYDHKHYCNGEGEIMMINPFSPLEENYRPCNYCKRLEKRKKKAGNGKDTKHSGAEPVHSGE